MPECLNCGRHVSATAARVLYADPDRIEGCTFCGVYAGGEGFREPRSTGGKNARGSRNGNATRGVAGDDLRPKWKPEDE